MLEPCKLAASLGAARFVLGAGTPSLGGAPAAAGAGGLKSWKPVRETRSPALNQGPNHNCLQIAKVMLAELLAARGFSRIF